MKIKQVIALASLGFFLAACQSGNELTVIPSAGACNVDGPKASSEVDKKSKLAVWGWAFDKSAGKVIDSITVELVSADERTVIKVDGRRDLPRPDVASAFANPALERAGFSATIDLAAAPSGVYQFAVIQKEANRLIVCTPPSKVVVR